jgi:hypothetical protein
MSTENDSATSTKTAGEPSTSDCQLLGISTNKDLVDARSTTLNHDNNRQHTSSDSNIAVTAALGAVAGLSCFVTSFLLVILIIQRKNRGNGKAMIMITL